MTSELSQFKVLVFDCYGTLIDWESGIFDALQPVLKKYAPQWSREQALVAFTNVEADLQVQYPKMLYSEILAKSHEAFELRLWENTGETGSLEKTVTSAGVSSGAGIGTDESEVASTSTEDPAVRSANDPHIAFAESIKSWTPFPDTVEALQHLAKHYKLVILSNVDRLAFTHTLALLTAPQQSSPFSRIITAQDTGAYKPSTIGFEYALSTIESSQDLSNAKRDEVLAVAQSLYHDHVPAKKLGLNSVWIDRQGAVMGKVPESEHGGLWTWRFTTLGEMAQAVGDRN